MDLSGFGINKVFKTNLPPAAPYYYITGSLDLTGLTYGNYYFNLDNNFLYGSHRDYSRYLTLGDNLIISEVVVYSDPSILLLNEDAPVSFLIGGSSGPFGSMDPIDTRSVVVPWAGMAGLPAAVPPEFSWSPLSVDDINLGAVNYFGHEGGHFPYYTNLNGDPDTSNRYRYLTLTISEGVESVSSSSEPSTSRKRKKLSRGILPVGDSLFHDGRITVSLKVYPKFQ
jgi:hypothetical protein